MTLGSTGEGVEGSIYELRTNNKVCVNKQFAVVDNCALVLLGILGEARETEGC